jgi:outer membrane protein OmpA-like peptidoglycan-associated protein
LSQESHRLQSWEYVKVKAYASPEGSEAYNQELSEKRAYIVSEYLIHNGVTVDEAVGCGVDGDASNRVAIVTVQ